MSNFLGIFQFFKPFFLFLLGFGSILSHFEVIYNTVHIRPSVFLRAGAPAPTRPRGLASPPEQTAAIMMPDKWNGFPGIRTGDRGYLDQDGFLHITGRFKDEYKLMNGKYVHPEGIENEMKLLRYVSSAMLYGDGKDYNVAIVVPNFEAMKVDPQTAAWSQGTPTDIIAKKVARDFLSQAIMAHLGKTFGGYEVPKKFLFLSEDFTIESGMLTQTSKLKRSLVMQTYGEKLLALYNE